MRAEHVLLLSSLTSFMTIPFTEGAAGFLVPSSHIRNCEKCDYSRHISTARMGASFLDDFLGGMFKNNQDAKNSVSSEKEDDEMNMESWKKELDRRTKEDEEDEFPAPSAVASSSTDDIGTGDLSTKPMSDLITEEEEEEEDEFDGYAMRDAILFKFGHCFDVDFRPVQSLGETSIYLNIMPFRLGSRRFRHETEYDYLCHLQAVVDILKKYHQLDNILVQMEATNKKPRAGTSPLVAVPLKLDLTKDQLKEIVRGI